MNPERWGQIDQLLEASLEREPFVFRFLTPE